jgi:hypothetical protein
MNTAPFILAQIPPPEAKAGHRILVQEVER